MKEIKAIIQPFMLNKVIEALGKTDLNGIAQFLNHRYLVGGQS